MPDDDEINWERRPPRREPKAVSFDFDDDWDIAKRTPTVAYFMNEAPTLVRSALWRLKVESSSKDKDSKYALKATFERLLWKGEDYEGPLNQEETRSYEYKEGKEPVFLSLLEAKMALDLRRIEKLRELTTERNLIENKIKRAQEHVKGLNTDVHKIASLSFLHMEIDEEKDVRSG